MRCFSTHEYVSGMLKRITAKHNPANMVKIQNSHLQEIPATCTYPPTIGPSAGPANGVITKMAIAVPLVSLSQLKRKPQLGGEGVTCSADKSTHISASIAPELVSGAAAKHPPRKRKMRKAGPFGATAQAICRILEAPRG